MITIIEIEASMKPPTLREIVSKPVPLIELTATFRRALRKAARKYGRAAVKEMAFWVISMEESLVELLWTDSLEARLVLYKNWDAYKRRAWEEFDALQQEMSKQKEAGNETLADH